MSIVVWHWYRAAGFLTNIPLTVLHVTTVRVDLALL